MQKQPPYMFYKNRCSWKFRLSPATLLKKRIWHRCFPVNFVKFLRTPFLQNTSGRMFQNRNGKDKNLLLSEISVESSKNYNIKQISLLLVPMTKSQKFLEQDCFFLLCHNHCTPKNVHSIDCKKICENTGFHRPAFCRTILPFSGRIRISQNSCSRIF